MKIILSLLILLAANYADAAEIKHPIVLELFTSQSCSSCPPADALIQKLAANDNNLLPLLFHIDYWDRLGWKDTYSAHEYTDRQNAYAAALGANNIFTPQLIINGVKSLNGSDSSNINQAIIEAKKFPTAVSVSIIPNDNKLKVTISGKDGLDDLDILQIQFDTYSKTRVASGENGGRMLETINNVTSAKSLGKWHKGDNKIFFIDVPPSGVTILAQAPGPGQIYGAASYVKQK